MDTLISSVAAFSVVCAAGLAAWAGFAIAAISRRVHRLGTLDGMHFEPPTASVSERAD